MIIDVGAWAVRQSCLDRSKWLEARLNAPRIAINVSTVQLERDNFVRAFASLLRLAGSEAGIDIEVTESVLMANVDDNIRKLTAIRDLGVGISLAHALQMETIAEGVESEEQAKLLRLLRCRQMQGYLISKPLTYDEMTAFLARHPV